MIRKKLASITNILEKSRFKCNKKENLERRRIEKIFTQINKIGSKGRDNELEYKKYVDDIVARGDYDNLLQCLYYYYDIDTQNLKQSKM
jgi:hypothetical protein